MFVARVDGSPIPGLCCYSGAGETPQFSNRADIDSEISFYKSNSSDWLEVELSKYNDVVLSMFVGHQYEASFGQAEPKRLVSECYLLIASRSLILRNILADSDRAKTRTIRERARAEARAEKFQLSRVANHAVETILQYVSNVEEIGVYQLDYRYTKIREIRKLEQLSGVNDHRFRLFCQGCLKSRNPTEFEASDKFFLLIPMSPETENSIFYNCVAILPNHSLLQASTMTAFQSFLEIYSNSYLAEAKSRCLHELHLLLKQSYPTDPEQFDWSYIQKALTEIFSTVGDNVLPLTNSHSFTFRTSSEKFSRLEPMVERCSSEGTRNIDFRKAMIGKFDTAKSCNAFTFAYCSQEEGYIYIPDLKRIPAEYRSRGLADVKIWRKSKSEITIPFYFKDTKLGVVNLESAQSSNYDSHTGFLLEAVNMVSRFLETLMSRFDTQWVGELTKSRAALHEAWQITSQEMSRSEDGPLEAKNRRNLARLNSMLNLALTAKARSSQGKLSGIIESILSGFDEAMAAKMKQIVINVDEAGVIDGGRNPHLQFILQEVITNFIKSADSRNKLKISYFSQRNIGQEVPAVVVETTFYDFIGETEARQMALQPLTFDGRRHYGTYLCAALSRTAGGWVTVEGSPMLTPYMHLTYRIPIF